MENKYYEDEKKKRELKDKVSNGKMKMYYKPGMNQKDKEEILNIAKEKTGLIVKG
jgi:hypothetical protein